MDFDRLIVDPSLDACLAAAALLALHSQPNRVQFTIAAPEEECLGFVVRGWPAKRERVVFVGPFAGRDDAPGEPSPPSAIVALLRALADNSHTVVGILDVHPRAWRAAMVAAQGHRARVPAPLVGHDLLLYPLRSGDDPTGTFVSAAEVLLAQRGPVLGPRGAMLPEHVELLCRMATRHARDASEHRAVTLLFQQERALGDWALAALIRALATLPDSPDPGARGEQLHGGHVRATIYHDALLAESHRAGALIVVLAGPIAEDLDNLAAKALRQAPIAVIGWQRWYRAQVRVAVRSHRIDLLALAKRAGVSARGAAHAVDVAPDEAELVLAAALAAYEQSDLAL